MDVIAARLLSAAAAKVYATLLVAALVWGAIQTVRIEGLWFVDGFKQAVADRDDKLAKIVTAQAVAVQKAEAARVATHNAYLAVARSADNEPATIERLRSAADRFADARRLRPQALCRPAGGANAPGQDDPAPNRDGPGVDAVVLTRPEYDDFVSNSLRLERVRQWGDALINQGLAAPEVEFGDPLSPQGSE